MARYSAAQIPVLLVRRHERQTPRTEARGGEKGGPSAARVRQENKQNVGRGARRRTPDWQKEVHSGTAAHAIGRQFSCTQKCRNSSEKKTGSQRQGPVGKVPDNCLARQLPSSLTRKLLHPSVSLARPPGCLRRRMVSLVGDLLSLRSAPGTDMSADLFCRKRHILARLGARHTPGSSNEVRVLSTGARDWVPSLGSGGDGSILPGRVMSDNEHVRRFVYAGGCPEDPIWLFGDPTVQPERSA